MPNCGSQIILCDLPIRFDTYTGCSHACQYCFVFKKYDISKIKQGESIESLRSFISGSRNTETNWCDWDIPLHWGGLSDPFQPIEKAKKKSLEALKVFAETGYPFVVSTKSALISEEPYLSLIKQCNCVVQISALCPRYDSWEKGASTFDERMKAAEKISPFRRVIFRCQPYIPAIFKDMHESIMRFEEVGAYGAIFEAMKWFNKIPGTKKVGGDYCYPAEMLEKHFEVFRKELHKRGMKFYSGENRLRRMGDNLCCCGVEDLGWRVNTANLNHLTFAPETATFTDKMREPGTAKVFKAIHQDCVSQKVLTKSTYESVMMASIGDNYAFTEPIEIPSDAKVRIREYLRAHLRKSGIKAVDVNKHLGTQMASHYFGESQWYMPTKEAYSKMSEIIPGLEPYEKVLLHIGKIRINGGGNSFIYNIKDAK